LATNTSPVYLEAPDSYPALVEERVRRAGPDTSTEFRERRFVPWLLAATDIVGVQIALTLGRALWTFLVVHLPALHLHTPSNGVSAGLMLIPLGNYLAGIYPGYGLGPVERLRRRIITVVMVFGALAVWDSMVSHSGWSRGILLLTFVFALASPAWEAVVVWFLMRHHLWGAPVVVLSANHAGTVLARTLRQQPELGFVTVAFFKVARELWGKTVDGVPVLGPPSAAADLAGSVKIAVVAMPGLKRSELVGIVEQLPFQRVIVVPELAGLQSLWVHTRDMGGNLGLELTRNLLLQRNYYLKRVVDYALGLPLFLLSLPLIAVLALWIKRVSPGPAFYTQEREGHQGKPIRIWKLRTMYLNAEVTLARYLAENPREREHWERFFKLKSDPRILPGIGNLLRKTSLDELPQLWNVLRGELSLAGPRPFPRYHMESFDDDFRTLRRSVMPGVTGFWQIASRSDGDLQVQEHLDTYYIRNWSLWLDVYILARTAVVVLLCRGAY
jgi:Undecaprenyl-phosphate galactose phosphotransferase WbaP